jgi:hypothetical protein
MYFQYPFLKLKAAKREAPPFWFVWTVVDHDEKDPVVERLNTTKD